jgi:hypothetical protein
MNRRGSAQSVSRIFLSLPLSVEGGGALRTLPGRLGERTIVKRTTEESRAAARWLFDGPPSSDARAQARICENDPVSPTVLRSGPYRFFFFASDRNEPPHVHVGRERKTAKCWLSPVRVAYNYGFAENDLNRIQGIVRQHEAELLKAWHDYFKPSN